MKLMFFSNTDWYLYNFRLSLALELRRLGHTVTFVSPPGDYCTQFEAQGIPWIPLEMDRRSLEPHRELAAIARLIAILRREQPDVLHNHTIKCVVYGSLAGRLAGSGAVVNSISGMGHVFSGEGRLNGALRRLLRLLLGSALAGRSTRTIVQNPDDAHRLGRFHPAAAGNIRLIRGSGVNCEEFRPAEVARADGRFHVLMGARLLWDKGVGEYVAAARSLRRSHPEIDFLLAGMPDPGNPAAVPEVQLRAWHDEGAVTWLGHVESMAPLLQSVDAFALPSYYGEGLPKGLIEAAASGLPIVTTDNTGCREVVADGRNGFLVPPRDTDALAEAIVRLHADAQLRARFGAEGRRRAVTEFDERLIIARTLDVYDEVTDREPPDAPQPLPVP